MEITREKKGLTLFPPTLQRHARRWNGGGRQRMNATSSCLSCISRARGRRPPLPSPPSRDNERRGADVCARSSCPLPPCAPPHRCVDTTVNGTDDNDDNVAKISNAASPGRALVRQQRRRRGETKAVEASDFFFYSQVSSILILARSGGKMGLAGSLSFHHTGMSIKGSGK